MEYINAVYGYMAIVSIGLFHSIIRVVEAVIDMHAIPESKI